MPVNVNQRLKEQVRETFIEIMETERETFYPLFMEIMEDIAIVKAMSEGEKTLEVEERRIIGLLEE